MFSESFYFYKNKFSTLINYLIKDYRIGIIFKGEITITKRFQIWKDIVYAQDGKLKEHGIKFSFAGNQKDDPTKLHVVKQFPNWGSTRLSKRVCEEKL